MRWVLVAALLIAPAIADAGPTQSNPAFLGVGFQDVPGAGCVIESVTRLGAAAEAGIEVGDLITAIDSIPILNGPCTTLVTSIVAHQPGDRVRIEARRGDRTIVATATLTTRAEVLQKRIGKRITSTELVDVDDTRRSYDLSERGNRTSIVGWFAPSCSGCAKVFDRVNDGIAKRIPGATPLVLAVAAVELHDQFADPRAELAALRKGFMSSVPLAATDSRTFESLAMLDSERIFFMVIDCHGIVQFVAPVAPDADDLDAAVDEVLAAAEQAEHARTQRR